MSPFRKILLPTPDPSSPHLLSSLLCKRKPITITSPLLHVRVSGKQGTYRKNARHCTPLDRCSKPDCSKMALKTIANFKCPKRRLWKYLVHSFRWTVLSSIALRSCSSQNLKIGLGGCDDSHSYGILYEVQNKTTPIQSKVWSSTLFGF